jgi:hypothetical protein
VAIQVDDLLAPWRRPLRATAKAPRSIELCSQFVRYSSGWLDERGREPVFRKLTRPAVATASADLTGLDEPNPPPSHPTALRSRVAGVGATRRATGQPILR